MQIYNKKVSYTTAPSCFLQKHLLLKEKKCNFATW